MPCFRFDAKQNTNWVVVFFWVFRKNACQICVPNTCSLAKLIFGEGEKKVEGRFFGARRHAARLFDHASTLQRRRHRPQRLVPIFLLAENVTPETFSAVFSSSFFFFDFFRFFVGKNRVDRIEKGKLTSNNLATSVILASRGLRRHFLGNRNKTSCVNPNRKKLPSPVSSLPT